MKDTSAIRAGLATSSKCTKPQQTAWPLHYLQTGIICVSTDKFAPASPRWLRCIRVSDVGSCTLGLLLHTSSWFALRYVEYIIMRCISQRIKSFITSDRKPVQLLTPTSGYSPRQELCLSSQTYSVSNSTTECDGMIYEQHGARTSQMTCRSARIQPTIE